MADESNLTTGQKEWLGKLRAAKGKAVSVPNVTGAKLVEAGFAVSAKGEEAPGRQRGYAPFKLA